MDTGERPRSRPDLLPSGRTARWALGLLVAFALLKGLLWGVTIPAFWAADEDYHYLYVESLTSHQQLPARERPLYPAEYGKATIVIHYNEYGQGPRQTFGNDPRASLRELEALPAADREPSQFGRGVGVVHPPLYPILGATANAAAGDASILSRLTAVRFVSALIGAAAVYLAWLLAAQVLTRFVTQFAAAFLVAVQPMFSYMTGVANHDVALVAAFSASLAMMLFLLRSPPAVAQGAWLGGAIAAALLVKATALVLLPLAALVYIAQGLTYRRWSDAAKSAAVAGGVVLVLAGWWYVRAKLVYGSFTGVTGGVTTPGGGALAEGGLLDTSLGDVISWAREWVALTYRTYWWHFMYFEAPGQQSIWYWVPLAGIVVGTLGVARVAWTCRAHLLRAEHPLLRQMVLLLLAAAAVIVPFLGVDLMRRADGLGFFANGGRYLIPAYGGVAVLFVVGLRGLVGDRLLVPALVVAGFVAAGFGLRVYDFHYVNRYFGHADAGELLRRLSFDRPEFVTPATIATTAALAILTAAAAAVLALRSARGERAPAGPPSDTPPRMLERTEG